MKINGREKSNTHFFSIHDDGVSSRSNTPTVLSPSSSGRDRKLSDDADTVVDSKYSDAGYLKADMCFQKAVECFFSCFGCNRQN